MDPALFRTALESRPDTVESIFFGGMGEPLVHSAIIDMVSQAAAKNLRVELLTNATLLDPEMSRRLIEAGLDMLWISADSFTSPSSG